MQTKKKYSTKWKTIEQVMKEKFAMNTPETRKKRDEAFYSIFWLQNDEN